MTIPSSLWNDQTDDHYSYCCVEMDPSALVVGQNNLWLEPAHEKSYQVGISPPYDLYDDDIYKNGWAQGYKACYIKNVKFYFRLRYTK